MIARPARVARMMALGAVALMVTGCGSDQGQPGTAGSTNDSTAATAPSGSATGAHPALQIRDDQVGAYDVPVSSWRAVGAKTLELSISAGPADCYGAKVKVVENASSVSLRVQVGSLPAAAGRDCAAIATSSTVRVSLAAPLGQRKVVTDPA